MRRAGFVLLALVSGGCIFVRDEDSLTSGAQPDAEVPACSNNLVSNASFETGTSGWKGTDGEITWVAPGRPPSDHAVRVCNVGGASVSFKLGDEPASIQVPTVGTSYRLTGWVRAEAAPVQALRAVLREVRPGTGSVFGNSSDITLTPEWQRADGTLTITSTDSLAVDAAFNSRDALAGSCFEVDDICLQRLE